jgi:hypothetical protein
MMLSPAGAWEGEVNRLLWKSNDHVIKTMSNKMRRRDADQAHQAIWAAKMAYLLPITSMSSAQLEIIQKRACMHGESWKNELQF